MPNYCVNKVAQTNGDHEVHNLDGGCRYIPAPANQVPLGWHGNCQGAVREAKRYYTQSNGCAFCAPSCHTG